MAGSLWAIFLVLWTGYDYCLGNTFTCYPPYLDDHNRTLTCSGIFETGSRERRSLHWETQTPDGKNYSRAACHSTKTMCNYSNAYVATASFTDRNYTTSFTVPVIPPDRFDAIYFKIYYKETDIVRTLNSWKMLKKTDSVGAVTEQVKVTFTNEVNVGQGLEDRANQDIRISSKTSCTEENKTIHLLCTATMLSSPAILMWFINNTFTGDNVTRTSDDSGYYKSESSIQLPYFSLTSKSQIKCEAHFNLNGTPKIISNTTTVDTISPQPRPPYFVYKGNRIPGNILSLTERESVDKLVCQAHGSGTAVSAVRVKCQTSNSSNNTISQVRYGASVSCYLNYTKVSDSRGICLCSAHYDSACYNTTTTLTFYVRVRNISRQQPVSSKSIIAYLIIGFSVSVSSIFVLGIFMYIISQWDSLYTYVKPSRSRKKAKTSCDECHVYATIDSTVSVLQAESQILQRNFNNSWTEMSTNARHVCCDLHGDIDTAFSAHLEPVTPEKATTSNVAFNTHIPTYLRSSQMPTEDADSEISVQARRYLRPFDSSTYINLYDNHSLYINIPRITRQSAGCKSNNVQFNKDCARQLRHMVTPTQNPTLCYGQNKVKNTFTEDYKHNVLSPEKISKFMAKQQNVIRPSRSKIMARVSDNVV